MASCPSAIALAATTGSAPTDRVSASVHAGVSPAAACQRRKRPVIILTFDLQYEVRRPDGD